MSSPIIQVENLCKEYTLSHQGAVQPYQTLRDTMAGWFRNSKPKTQNPKIETFQALKDVSFEVKQGEVLGVIGRNGAGKSTLLKILSRITEPTSGRVRLKGRVASLLEVGTGFHPELTGRENIFLNGAILGMKKAEIRKKFDEIVEFAEVEKFLDTPVKRYSSGMYVRLAFAVAAHLEPEILIVDEVLAVGDQEFQRKCLGKMQDVSAKEGRTVLFVSHNMAAIRQLCGRALLLNSGGVKETGSVSSVLRSYNASLEQGSSLAAPLDVHKFVAHAQSFRLETTDGKAVHSIRVGENWRMCVQFNILRRVSNFVISLGVVNGAGLGLQTAWSQPCQLAAGRYKAIFNQQHVHLAADSYKLLFGLSEDGRTIQQIEAGTLDILGDNPLIPCAATSGCGFIINSMDIQVYPIPS